MNGALNFIVLKARISLVLEENSIKDYVTTIVVVPIDAKQLAACKKDDAKVRRIILHGFKDHIVPHILDLYMAMNMWDDIMNL